MGEIRDGRVFAQKGSDVAASDIAAVDSASGHDAGPGPRVRQHARRTVGVTEQRLRDANRQSWMSTPSGWAKWLRRFMPGRG